MSDGQWIISMAAVFTPVIVGFMELHRALRRASQNRLLQENTR